MQEQPIENHHRKTQLASYLAHLLQSLKLPRTALTLRSQANLKIIPNIQQELQELQEQQQQPQELKQAYQKYFERLLKKVIRENYIQEAWQIFSEELPKYVENIQPFALLFAHCGEREVQSSLEGLLKKCVGKGEKIEREVPDFRSGRWQFFGQIWFVQIMGQSILVVDDKANARVIFKDQIVGQRVRLHDSPILSLTSNNLTLFASSPTAPPHHLHLHNLSLQHLYTMSRHSSPITSLCIIDSQLASFDNNGIIVVTTVLNEERHQRNSIPSYKLKGIGYVDVRYLKGRKGIVGAGVEEGRGRLDLADLGRRKCTTKVRMEEKIYNIEVSTCQSWVFANLSSNQIHAYSTSNFTLDFKITGYHQHSCLMRMALSGPLAQNTPNNTKNTKNTKKSKDDQILAVTSEQGCVCLFSLNAKELIGKIYGQSRQMINCVKWKDEGRRIVFGCDGGAVQQWSHQQNEQEDNKNENEKENRNDGNNGQT